MSKETIKLIYILIKQQKENVVCQVDSNNLFGFYIRNQMSHSTLNDLSFFFHFCVIFITSEYSYVVGLSVDKEPPKSLLSDIENFSCINLSLEELYGNLYCLVINKVIFQHTINSIELKFNKYATQHNQLEDALKTEGISLFFYLDLSGPFLFYKAIRPEAEEEKNKALFIEYATMDLFIKSNFFYTERFTITDNHNELHGSMCSVCGLYENLLRKHNFYYVFGYIKVSGAEEIYNFLNITLRQINKLEICGSHWKEEESKLYFWLAFSEVSISLYFGLLIKGLFIIKGYDLLSFRKTYMTYNRPITKFNKYYFAIYNVENSKLYMDSHWTLIENTISEYAEPYLLCCAPTLVGEALIEAEELIGNRLKETYNVDEYSAVDYGTFLHYIVRLNKNFDKYYPYPDEDRRYCDIGRFFIWFLLPKKQIEFEEITYKII